VLSACVESEPPVRVTPRDCIPASHLVSSPNTTIIGDDEIIERAKAYSLSTHGERALIADETIIWAHTSEDETHWEGTEYHARHHRTARDAGLQRYAIVWLRVRDRLVDDVEHRRNFYFDQCGNPMLLP